MVLLPLSLRLFPSQLSAWAPSEESGQLLPEALGGLNVRFVAAYSDAMRLYIAGARALVARPKVKPVRSLTSAGVAAPRSRSRTARLSFPDGASTRLKAWMIRHLDAPYPTPNEKKRLSKATGLSVARVACWFVNARMRMWKRWIEESSEQQRHVGVSDADVDEPSTAPAGRSKRRRDNGQSEDGSVPKERRSAKRTRRSAVGPEPSSGISDVVELSAVAAAARSPPAPPLFVPLTCPVRSLTMSMTSAEVGSMSLRAAITAAAAMSDASPLSPASRLPAILFHGASMAPSLASSPVLPPRSFSMQRSFRLSLTLSAFPPLPTVTLDSADVGADVGEEGGAAVMSSQAALLDRCCRMTWTQTQYAEIAAAPISPARSDDTADSDQPGTRGWRCEDRLPAAS